ncbi:MAG: ATP-binding protein [Silanimonas sp.]
MTLWLRSLSLRTRLLGVIVTVTLIAILTFGSLALLSEQRAARRALASETEAMATLVANRSAAALVFGDDALAQENLDALSKLAQVQAACLYDSMGALFTGYSAPGTRPCEASWSARVVSGDKDPLADERLEVAVPVELDERVGTLVLRSSLQPLRDRLREQAHTWALTGAIGAALAMLLGVLFERLISGPIRRLSDIVDATGAKGTTARRATVEGRDEIGHLAEAYNRMLDRLDEQTRGLKLQAEYNEVLFKRSPLPVIVIDPRAKCLVDCNEAAVAIYGYGTREATLNTDASDVSAPLQYDGTPSAEAIVPYERAAMAGAPQVYDWRHRRPDGSEFDAEVHLNRFGPEDAPMLLASLFDVTERKASAAALQRMNEALESRVAERTRDLAASNAELSATVDQLQRTQGELVRSERLASLGSLVAGVAHELNTPLGSALLVATTLGDGIEDLRRKLQSGELKRSTLDGFLQQQAEAQALIVRNARRAAELIGRFKQVAVDQTSEQRRRFDLAEVVDEIIGTLQPRLRKTPHLVVVDIAPGMAMDSYPGPLGQVVTNLVLNALLHGLGDRPGEVRLSAHTLEGDQVALSVSDDGVGIPPEHLPRIFDPFFTTKLGEGGSGLGLHIVYSLVQRGLGGRIDVDSVPGHGARFTVVLPRVAPPMVDPN